MNYLRALQVVASHIDASVNQDSSSLVRLEHQHLSYWFTKVLEYSNSDNKEVQDRYLRRILQSPLCHAFDMVDFLIDGGVIDINMVTSSIQE